ncbi:MAG: DUF4340 domain-containing protein [Spirochaetaceae bacterium]|nr:DUF4340 domain-containing protein [Spirochaetaceae bacterium]
MTEKKYLGLLTGACGVLVVLCIIASVGKKSLSGKTIDTVLLNEKYASQLACVEVMQQEKSIVLYRKDLSGKNLWLGTVHGGSGFDTSSSMVFPVDSTLMEEFLATMMQVRSLSLVSQKQDQETLASFGLASQEGFSQEGYTFSFLLQDGTVASQVIFGDTNYSGYRIYLKTPESPVYLTEDDFYPWLSLSAKSWAEMDLVSRQLLGITGTRDVQGLEIKVFDEEGARFHKNIMPTNEDFSSKVSRLLSLRGGSLIEPSVVLGRKLLGEITLDTGSGSRSVLQVYEGQVSQLDQEVSSYYLIPQIYSRGGDEISGLSYGFEISSWTWEALLALAED